MFQFPSLANVHYVFMHAYLSSRWVSPFGNARIIECVLLPEPYRSLPRPSSLPDAKASTISP